MRPGAFAFLYVVGMLATAAYCALSKSSKVDILDDADRVQTSPEAKAAAARILWGVSLATGLVWPLFWIFIAGVLLFQRRLRFDEDGARFEPIPDAPKGPAPSKDGVRRGMRYLGRWTVVLVEDGERWFVIGERDDFVRGESAYPTLLFEGPDGREDAREAFMLATESMLEEILREGRILPDPEGA